MQDNESVIIGWVLRDPKLFYLAEEHGLSPNDFSTDKGKKAWTVFKELVSSGEEIELIKAYSAFGADEYLIQAMDESPVSVNVEWVVGEIVENKWRSECSMALSRLAIEIRDNAAGDNIEASKSRISIVINDFIKSVKKSSHDIDYSTAVDLFHVDVESKIEAGLKDGMFGLPTGLKCLDQAFGGWQPASLIFIAARPGVGKTTLALNTTEMVSAQGKHVYFCSNEMSAIQLVGKHHSTLSKVSYGRIMSGDLNDYEKDQVFKASKKLRERHITIGEKNGRFIESFETACIARKREGRLDFAVLDYVQQVFSRDKKFGHRAQELSYISDRLKGLARELNIPIIALAQINRAADQSLPTLANLKDSGSLEQDADGVVILHNDLEKGYVASVAKNRFGMTGIMSIQCDLATSRFFD